MNEKKQKGSKSKNNGGSYQNCQTGLLNTKYNSKKQTKFCNLMLQRNIKYSIEQK